MHTVFLILLLCLYQLLHAMENSFTLSNMPLPNDITKIIEQEITTIAKNSSSGQFIALSLVCTSWKSFCEKNKKAFLKKSKQLNKELINNLYNPALLYFYGARKPLESDLLQVITFPTFDIRYQNDKNRNSLLRYAIEKNYFTLFEKALQLPYVLITPNILEDIIDYKKIAFVNILDKYSFNFGRYHFAYRYHLFSSRFTVESLITTVSYANKKYSRKKGKKIMRSLIRKKIATDYNISLFL